MKRFLLCALIGLSAPAFAAGVGRDGFTNFVLRESAQGIYELDMGGRRGSPVRTDPIPSGSARQLGNMTLSSGLAGLNLNARALVPLAGGSGGALVNVASRISTSSVLAAAWRCAGNPVCAGVSLVAGSALAEWLSSSGYSVGENGQISVSPSDYISCNAFGCYENVITEGNCEIRWTNSEGWCVAAAKLDICKNKADKYSFVGIKEMNSSMCIYQLQGFDHTGKPYVFSRYASSFSGRKLPHNPDWSTLSGNLQNTTPPIQVVEDLLLGGETVEPEALQVTGPAQVQGPTTTTTEIKPNPETGQNDTVETRTSTQYQLSYSDNRITFKPTTTQTTYVNGRVVSTRTVPTPNTETKPQNPEKPQEIKVETCGLPGKPACKIDETGTPEKHQDTHKEDVDASLSRVLDLANNPKDFWPELPSINWAFKLPTGCTAIQTPAFAPFLSEIDVCKFRPIFHDIMSVVWIIGGIFGSIGLFWRSVFSQSN